MQPSTFYMCSINFGRLRHFRFEVEDHYSLISCIDEIRSSTNLMVDTEPTLVHNTVRIYGVLQFEDMNFLAGLNKVVFSKGDFGGNLRKKVVALLL